MSGRFFIILFCTGAAALGIILWRIAATSATAEKKRADLERRLTRLEQKAGLPSPGPGREEITFDETEKKAATLRRLSRINKRVKKNEEDIRTLKQRPAVTDVQDNVSGVETDLAALLKSIDDEDSSTGEIMFTPKQLKTVRVLLKKVRE